METKTEAKGKRVALIVFGPEAWETLATPRVEAFNTVPR